MYGQVRGPGAQSKKEQEKGSQRKRLGTALALATVLGATAALATSAHIGVRADDSNAMQLPSGACVTDPTCATSQQPAVGPQITIPQ